MDYLIAVVLKFTNGRGRKPIAKNVVKDNEKIR